MTETTREELEALDRLVARADPYGVIPADAIRHIKDVSIEVSADSDAVRRTLYALEERAEKAEAALAEWQRVFGAFGESPSLAAEDVIRGRDEDKSRSERAEAEAARLREALELLVSEQNGPPLERDKDGWFYAMAQARAALHPTDTHVSAEVSEPINRGEGDRSGADDDELREAYRAGRTFEREIALRGRIDTDPAPAIEPTAREQKIASVLWLMYEHARLYMTISDNVERTVIEALKGTGHEPWQPPDPAPADRPEPLDENVIIRLMCQHGVEGNTFERSKDGIDITKPTPQMKAFVGAITLRNRATQRADRPEPTCDTCDDNGEIPALVKTEVGTTAVDVACPDCRPEPSEALAAFERVMNTTPDAYDVERVRQALSQPLPAVPYVLASERRAIESAIKFVNESIAPRRCDSDGVSGCWRCKSVYMAKVLERALAAEQTDG